MSSGVKPHLSMRNCVATPLSAVVDGVAISVQKLANLKWEFAMNAGGRRRDIASDNKASFFVSRLHII